VSTIFDDLNISDWQEIVAEAVEKHCYEYRRIFLHKAHAAKSEGHRWEAVYELMSKVTSLRLDTDQPRNALVPELETQEWRTFAPEDLSDEEVEALRRVASTIRDPELRARICDLCWTLDRRSYELGRLAISSYIESAVRVAATDARPLACDSVTRAVQIAALMGKRADQYLQLVDQLQAIVERPDLHLMVVETVVEQLVEQRAGDAAKLRDIAVASAARCREQSDFWRERSFLHLAERLSARSGDLTAVVGARRKQADSFLAEADALVALNDPTTIGAVAHRLEHGLHTLRMVAGTEAEQKVVHQRLLDSQFAQTEQMGKVSASTDLSDWIELTRSQFRDVKSVEDALFKLALIARSPRVDELRTEVEQGAKKYPLQHLFERVVVDSAGRPIGKRVGVLSSDGDHHEEAIRAQMASNANLHHALTVQAGILPAIDQINADHVVRKIHIEQLVRASPFVPPDHREAFVVGIYAGYEGRLLECAHVLSPQIEAAIRHVLDTNGVITSKLSADGTQERLNLNEMLGLDEASNILGEDLVFDMQCLFVERFGANLRNNVAHGLLRDEQFQSAEVMYCWWLILRLCCLPLIASGAQSRHRNEGAAES
jgi:Domain of unknown function (DUF4209)